MNVIQNLISGDSEKQSYSELKNEDLSDTPHSGQSVQFVDIRGQDDVVTAKELLNDGSIVIIDISYVDSNGISLRTVTNDLKSTVTEIQGDIVHKKRNDFIIAVPRDVHIDRQKQ